MSVQIRSTTDSAETVTAAIGEKAQTKEVEETKSASAEIESDETPEESETSDAPQEHDSEEGADDDESESKDEKPKKRKGFKKRIDKLNSKLSQKEQEVEYWRQQALKGTVSHETENKSAPKEPIAEGKPKQDDFESHAEYVEALTDWKLDQRDKAREAKQNEVQVKTEHQKRLEAHNARVKEFASTKDDFEEVIEELGDFRVSPALESLILDSENGGELIYELCKNKEELERICKLSPMNAARELGKFELRLQKPSSSSSETKEVKKTKPAPLKTVGTNTTGGVKKSIYDPDLSQREYDKLRAEQLKRRA